MVAATAQLVVTPPSQQRIVLNTKWKRPATHRPAAAHLQQLFAYCHLWHARRGLLLYPSPVGSQRPSVQRPYAPGQLAQAIHGHILFADILLEDRRFNPECGPALLAQFLTLPTT